MNTDERSVAKQTRLQTVGARVNPRYHALISAFERQTGYINPIGRRISEFQPDLERSWFERFAEVARTGEPVRFVQYTEAMGIWYDVYALPVSTEGDNRVSLLFTDITERKQAEDDLRVYQEILEQKNADLDRSDQRYRLFSA